MMRCVLTELTKHDLLSKAYWSTNGPTMMSVDCCVLGDATVLGTCAPLIVSSLPIYRSRNKRKGDTETQLTFRAVAAGLLVGSLLCCSNTYFGLQTGWVTMGSLQVRLEGAAI